MEKANAVEDSTNIKVKKERVRTPFRPVLQGIKLGTDLFPIGLTVFDKDFTGFEGNSELVFDNKFFVNADFGFQDAQRINNDTNTFVYGNKGNYWRIGLDYNFMHKKFSEHAIFVGSRFGHASFDHQATYTVNSTEWGDEPREVAFNGLSANWLELNLGLKIKTIGNLHLSVILRGKFLLSNPSSDALTVSEIPGYGINRNSVTGALGYRVSYLFPVRKGGGGTKKSPKTMKEKGDEKKSSSEEE